MARSKGPRFETGSPNNGSQQVFAFSCLVLLDISYTGYLMLCVTLYWQFFGCWTDIRAGNVSFLGCCILRLKRDTKH